jgi:hypothetical protein
MPRGNDKKNDTKNDEKNRRIPTYEVGTRAWLMTMAKAAWDVPCKKNLR